MTDYPFARDCKHGNKRGHCAECELRIASTEMDKLLSAIKQFCKGQKWADESWKNQPHVKPLFDIAKEAEKGAKT